MMKRIFFILPLICFLLSACEGETIDPIRASKSIRLTAEIEGLKTRLSDSTWEKGDAIGVYMKLTGASLDSSAPERNVQYIYNAETEEFEPRDEKGTIYFPFNGSNVDFISYYPYREDITNLIYPVDLKVQSNQAAIDLMYSNNVTAKNMSNPNVSMLFSHRLSKLVLQIAHYRNLVMDNLSVIITQVPTEASFDLANDTLTPSPATKDIALRVNSDGTAAEAILLPGTDLSGSELWFVTDNNEQIYQLPLDGIIPADTLELSTLYQLNVTLFTDEEYARIANGSITPWITPPFITVTANRTEILPPVIKGSKSDPYTVLEAKEAQGETDVWVKGYIVGGFSGNGISSFTTNLSEVKETNIGIADVQNETETANIMTVELPSGSIRDTLNLQSNPGNLNKQVLIKGDLTTYYSAPGLKNPKECQIITE
jgi:hypothetical protein